MKARDGAGKGCNQVSEKQLQRPGENDLVRNLILDSFKMLFHKSYYTKCFTSIGMALK